MFHLARRRWHLARVLALSEFYGRGDSFNPDFLVMFGEAAFVALRRFLGVFGAVRHPGSPLLSGIGAPAPQEFPLVPVST